MDPTAVLIRPAVYEHLYLAYNTREDFCLSFRRTWKDRGILPNSIARTGGLTMDKERNTNQIVRKDGKGCFVESLNDAFSIGRCHLAFAAYDLNRPAGERQTNLVQIYLDCGELLELCRKAESGELLLRLQDKKQKGDKTPLYQCMGGTSAEKLHRIGRPRPDGKSLSRIFQLLPGNKSDFLLVADSGPGETDEKGLIVPRFGKLSPSRQNRQEKG